MDVESGLGHTVTTTAANDVDIAQVVDLLYGMKKVVHADAGYTDAQARLGRKDWQTGPVLTQLIDI